MQRCDKHMFDEAVAVCADCGGNLCNDCVVGVKRHQFCIPCALGRAGVNHRGSVLSRTR